MPKVKSAFLDFVRCVVNGEIDAVSRHLVARPSFATAPSDVGATRQDASTFFFSEIAHYLYVGDTALHMAAAAFRRSVAELLVAHGADCRAKNRRGAEPLHYAADANHWDPTAQAETIGCVRRQRVSGLESCSSERPANQRLKKIPERPARISLAIRFALG